MTDPARDDPPHSTRAGSPAGPAVHAASRWLPFLRWPRPDAALLRGEFAAGLAVALLMIPQSVAYAALAGMPLVTGLYAALLPALVATLWGHSTRVSVGPTALTCLLVAASLSGMATPGSAQWVSLAVWLALMSGAIQLLMGLARFGWMLHIVSAPVMTGFTQAAALLIIGSQVQAFVGLSQPVAAVLQGFFTTAAIPATAAATAAAGAAAGATLDMKALGFGVAALTALLVARRLWPRLPVLVLVVALAALLSWGSGYSTQGHVIGALPVGLPAPYWPAWPGWERIGNLLVPAMVIALVSFLETAASARNEAQADARRWDENQDLIAQGLAKLASAVSGSFATSASFSRSAVALFVGARTGWSSLITVACVLLALLLLMPVLAHVPQAVLAAIVIVAVIGLIRPRELLQLWRLDRAEAGIAGITFAVTLLSAPRIHWGVITGVLMGMTHYLYQRLHPRIIEIGLHPDGSLRDRHLWKLPPLAPDLYAVRMDAALDFATAGEFERQITEHLASQPQLRHLCIFAQSINRIDVTGVHTFASLRQRLTARGVTLHLSGLKLPVETLLRHASLLEPDPLLRLYRTDAEALAAMAGLAGQAGLAEPART